jgi:hypothetical protein
MSPELNAYFHAVPPVAYNMGGTEAVPAIYHYTTYEGLHGIIGSQELRAANIHYLNDYTEFKHALEIASIKVEDRIRSGVKPETPLLMAVRSQLDTIRKISVCVACFSEKPDDLGQWRGYAGKSGVAIAFRYRDLHFSAQSQGFRILRCIYDNETKQRFVDHTLDDAVASYVGPPGPSAEATIAMAQTLIWNIDALAPAFKHSGFSEEREWRLVSAPRPMNHERMGYRSTAESLIPYFKFDLRSKLPGLNPTKENLGIGQIIIGPSRYQQANSDSVGGMLLRNRIDIVTIINSQVPYRTGP